MQIELSNKTSTIGQHKYLKKTTDQILQLVLVHDKTKKAHSISKQSYKFKQELNMMKKDEESDTNTSTKQARDIKKAAKTVELKRIKQMSTQKDMTVWDNIFKWKICQHYNVTHAENWYEHEPQKNLETESATVLWDFSIHTGRTIQANKPGIKIKDHKGKNMQTRANVATENINNSNSYWCIRLSEKENCKTSSKRFLNKIQWRNKKQFSLALHTY